MSDRKMITHLAAWLCFYCFGIMVCLYSLLDTWRCMNELRHPEIVFMVAGPGLGSCALGLVILGIRVFASRSRRS
jgi:hypothetical protein